MYRRTVHVGVSKTANNYTYTVYSKNVQVSSSEENSLKKIIKHLQEYKVLSLTASFKLTPEERSMLWLKEDIVVFDQVQKANSSELARYGSKRFIGLVPKLSISPNGQVLPQPLASGKEYQKTTSSKKWSELIRLAKSAKNVRIMYISATPRGGGVAIMRHSLVRVSQELGIAVNWHVLTNSSSIFTITKTKFHNVLQGMTHSQVNLSHEDKHAYETWIDNNFRILHEPISKADVVVIDDPQPSGLIPLIKDSFPQKTVLYRSHIQIDTAVVNNSSTPEHQVWSYLWNFIKKADKFISHPIPEFIPKGVPSDRVVFMPPSTDPLDGLNKPLSNRDQEYYKALFNKFLKNSNQTPLDFTRPYIIQIARFDPSKGFTDALDAYRSLVANLDSQTSIPQLVLVGNQSIDDPEATPILNLLQENLSQKGFIKLRKDIKVAPLPHIDQMLNTLLRNALVSLQLSHREGFEFKVIESLMKSVPVIAYESGGIPLQIDRGGNGILVKTGDVEAVSNSLQEIIKTPITLKKLRHNAAIHTRKDLTTVDNLIRWLELLT